MASSAAFTPRPMGRKRVFDNRDEDKTWDEVIAVRYCFYVEAFTASFSTLTKRASGDRNREQEQRGQDEK